MIDIDPPGPLTVRRQLLALVSRWRDEAKRKVRFLKINAGCIDGAGRVSTMGEVRGLRQAANDLQRKLKVL